MKNIIMVTAHLGIWASYLSVANSTLNQHSRKQDLLKTHWNHVSVVKERVKRVGTGAGKLSLLVLLFFFFLKEAIFHGASVTETCILHADLVNVSRVTRVCVTQKHYITRVVTVSDRFVISFYMPSDKQANRLTQWSNIDSLTVQRVYRVGRAQGLQYVTRYTCVRADFFDITNVVIFCTTFAIILAFF
jgi:hypothetical protein